MKKISSFLIACMAGISMFIGMPSYLAQAQTEAIREATPNDTAHCSEFGMPSTDQCFR